MERDPRADLPDLHDATLSSVGFDWRDGSLQATVRTSDGVRTLEFTGVDDVRLSHRLPWGPSEHIGNIRVEDLPNGIRAHIEMQRGDAIEIACKSVRVSDPS
jgi:hypothetical protein